MASPKLGAGLVSLLALSWLGAGCYSTTPHRAQIASAAEPQRCSAAIVDVFTRSGFVQLPTPLNLSMLFGPRLAGQYTSFMRAGAGVGVTIAPTSAGGGTCHVTLEALSPDVTCPAAFGTLSCNGGNGAASMNQVTGDSFRSSTSNAGALGACPTSPPLMCDLSYAPGDDNDAAVDELARRLRVVLGQAARVD